MRNVLELMKQEIEARPGMCEAFLTDFGMVKVERTDDRLYMRGRGAYPYINVSYKGEPGFKAVYKMLSPSGAHLGHTLSQRLVTRVNVPRSTSYDQISSLPFDSRRATLRPFGEKRTP